MEGYKQWLTISVTVCLIACIARGQLQCGANQCLTASPQPSPAMKEELAVTFAWCHTLCVNEVLQGSLMKLYAKPNCRTFRELVECRIGCYINTTSPDFSLNKCRRICRKKCRSGCDNPITCSSNESPRNFMCRNTCRRNPCEVGCQLATNPLIQLQDIPDPSDPAILMPTSSEFRKFDAGVFDIAYPNDTALTDIESEDQNIAVVFRVESSSNMLFFLPLTFDKTSLDLGFLACQTANLSFAVVTTRSMSTFSPVTQTCIHGVTPLPSQSSRARTAWIKEDFRPGFQGKAIMNITWEKPDQGFEHLTGYTLLVIGRGTEIECTAGGKIFKYAIEREATSYVLSAESKLHPPSFGSNVFGCNYNFLLRAEPSHLEEGRITTIKIQTVTDPPRPTIDFFCVRFVDDKTGLIGVLMDWTIIPSNQNSSEELQLIIDAIDVYRVTGRVTILEDGAEKLLGYLRPQTFRIENDTGSGQYILEGYPPMESETFYNFTFMMRNRLHWRLLPSWQDCDISAQPEQPHTISSITVEQINITGVELQLDLSWTPPEATFGNIEVYEIRVTYGHPELSTRPFFIFQTNMTLLNIHSRLPDTNTAHLEIRSKNHFLWSNWSNAIPLEILATETERNTESIERTTVTPKGLRVWMIYAPIMGGSAVILVAAVAILLLFFVGRSFRLKHQINNTMKGEADLSWLPADSNGEALFSRNPAAIKTDEWEIPSGNVVAEKELGEGCFGLVFQGTIRGPLPQSRALKNTICVTVAIKYLKENARSTTKKDFLAEMDTIKLIAKGNNPHVVNLIGVVSVQEPLCIITEYLKHGDLLSYLHDIRYLLAKKLRQVETEDQQYTLVPDPTSAYAPLGAVEAVNLLSFAYEIASGMEYLSSLNIIHCDLACRNILVGEGKKLKISDFGLSRVLCNDPAYVKTTKGRRPWKWMGIESLRDGEFTSASDVWAYGVTLWEISSLGGFPYPSVPNRDLLQYLQQGNRLECPENCSPEIYQVMLSCWMENPKQRPSFSELRSSFEALLSQDTPYIQFSNADTSKIDYEHLQALNEEENDTVAFSSPDVPVNNLESATSCEGYDHLPETTESTLPYVVNPYVHTPKQMPYSTEYVFSEAAATAATAAAAITAATTIIACEKSNPRPYDRLADYTG